jgi:hypothetical protein
MAVSTKFTDAAALQAYVWENRETLVSKAFNSFRTSQYLTFHEGIKGKMPITELLIGNLTKRWAAGFVPDADTVEFSPRTLSVTRAKAELQFLPQDFEGSYLGEARKKGQNWDDIPFEAYIMERVMAKIAEEHENAVWKATEVSPANAAHTLSQIFDGYLEIIIDEITATNLTPVPVPGGAWSEANIIPTLEAMWDQLKEAYKDSGVNVYLNYNLFALYNRAYRNQFGINADRPLDGRLRLDFGEAYLVPLPGLAGRNRVIMTPPGNLHIGIDSPADMTFGFEQDKRYMDFWMDFNIGTQIALVNDEVLVVNDLA